MSTTFDAANHYFSGQGVLMIGSKDSTTGLPTGLRPVGNVPDLKISPATTVVEHKGSQDGQRATDARLQTELKITCSFTLENWIADNLAKATRGGSTLIPAGTSTNEALIGYTGLVTGLRYIRVSSLTLKQSSTSLVKFNESAPTTPYDYKLNTDAGSIMLNDPSVSGVALANLTAGSPVVGHYALTATYNYDAQFLVDALTQPLADNWLHFEGLNTVEENSPVIVDIYRFVNDPLKELALLSDTFGQFVIDGSCLKDDTRVTGSKYFSIKKLE